MEGKTRNVNGWKHIYNSLPPATVLIDEQQKEAFEEILNQAAERNQA